MQTLHQGTPLGKATPQVQSRKPIVGNSSPRCLVVPHSRRAATQIRAWKEFPGQDGGKQLGQGALAALAAASLILGAPGDAIARGTKVAEFSASGLIFKDSVEVTALDDQDIDGVTVYVSDFKRSIVDKLAKDFFSEPSQASVTCAVTGPVSFRKSPDQLGGAEGQEILSESKGLNLFKNKTLRIRRIYDAPRNTLVYVAYSTRLGTAADDGSVSSGRYRTSLCAVSLPASALAPPTAADN